MDLIQKACDLGFILKNKEYYLWEIQKWLREVHNIDAEVEKYQHNKKCKLYKCRITGIDMENLGYITGYSSYEEALEVGLFESLKLIKI